MGEIIGIEQGRGHFQLLNEHSSNAAVVYCKMHVITGLRPCWDPSPPSELGWGNVTEGFFHIDCDMHNICKCEKMAMAVFIVPRRCHLHLKPVQLAVQTLLMYSQCTTIVLLAGRIWLLYLLRIVMSIVRHNLLPWRRQSFHPSRNITTSGEHPAKSGPYTHKVSPFTIEIATG